MKGIAVLAAAIALIALVGVSGFIASGGLTFQTFGLEEAVFCNLYEFQCCALDSPRHHTGTVKAPFFGSGKVDFTCPADKCVITAFTHPSDVSGARISVNGQTRSAVAPVDLRLNDKVESVNFLDLRFDYTAQDRQLFWTGSAASTTGVEVAGSDRCTFTTDQSIYDEQGRLLRSPTDGEQSYTVPVNRCYQIVRNERFICGLKSNECSAHSDCASGRTYTFNDPATGQRLGAEASGGTLQLYGCTQRGSAPTQSQKDILPGESQSSTQFSHGNRCEVIRTQAVQCIPGQTSCGANAVCDVATFTCKQSAQIECRADSECGRGEVYDQNTKTWRRPVCTPQNTCSFEVTRQVQCAFASECPVGFFCDAAGSCKESVQPKQACPSACCEGDPRFFDRPAPPGQVCCPGGSKTADTLDACNPAGGGGECAWWNIGCWLFGGLLGGAGSLLAGIGGFFITILIIIAAILFMWLLIRLTGIFGRL